MMPKINRLIKELEKNEMFFRKFFRMFFEERNKVDPVIIEKIVEKTKFVDRPVEKEIKVIEAPDWAKHLEPQYELLQIVVKYPALAEILLPTTHKETLLSQLISNSSQWSKILRVWDALAAESKSSKQPSNQEQLSVLNNCLALFNLTVQNNFASLKLPQVGDDYDYKEQQSVNNQGDKISMVLLAGLYNAAGEKARSAVVITR